jgi:hypothetical protein
MSTILGLAEDSLAPAVAEVRIERRIMAAPAKSSKKADAAKLAEVARAAKLAKAKWDTKQDAARQKLANELAQRDAHQVDLALKLALVFKERAFIRATRGQVLYWCSL